MEFAKRVKERIIHELKLYDRKGEQAGSRWRIGYADGLRKALKIIEEEEKEREFHP